MKFGTTLLSQKNDHLRIQEIAAIKKPAKFAGFLNLMFKSNYFSAAIEAIAASTPSIESAAFLIRASASTSTSSAVA